MEKTIEQMEAALRESGFFCGGLNDEQIEHYYKKYIEDQNDISRN